MKIAEKKLIIIKPYRKSLLYHEDETWKKKESQSCVEVTMRSNNGAEICELTVISILSYLSKRVPQEASGLYRDDSLILLQIQMNN